MGLVDAKKFLDNLDIFIFPSNWEGLGLAVLEAAALEKPIIASNIDGIKEIINTSSGFLFAPKNSDDLAEKIDYLLDNYNNPDIKAKVKTAHEKIAETFNLEKMVNRYEGVYENYLKEYENTPGK